LVVVELGPALPPFAAPLPELLTAGTLCVSIPPLQGVDQSPQVPSVHCEPSLQPLHVSPFVQIPSVHCEPSSQVAYGAPSDVPEQLVPSSHTPATPSLSMHNDQSAQPAEL
jgi:hypothetical protein